MVSKWFRRWASRAAMALIAAVPAFAAAQQTSGNSGTGATLFAANCQTAGCHTGGPLNPYTAPANAANAGGIIAYAISQGMTSALTTQNYNDIAAYIATLVPSTNPTNVAVPFNAGGASPTAIAIPNIVFPTAWGALTGVRLSTQGGTVSPQKGSVSFSGTTANYTPTVGASGTDQFVYEGFGPGGRTAPRTATVIIGNPPAPVISSSLTASGQSGVSFSYTITANNFPASFNATNLPAGLTFSSPTISGAPSAPGVYNINISASNAGGADNKVLVLTVTLGPPSITSGATATGAEGVAFSGYTVTATNSPTTFGGSGLPPGLSVNPSTGVVTGTPTVTAGPYPQTYNATVTAANGVLPNGSKIVTFTINKPVPTVNSAAAVTGFTGVPFTYQVTGTQGPLTGYGLTGTLPAGLAFSAATGQITGTPTTVGGPTTVSVTATNTTGTSLPSNVDITIALGPPSINSALSANGSEGSPFSYQITATNPPITAWGATGLPSGLTVDPVTGLISGTIGAGAAAGSPYTVTLSATNSNSTTTRALTLNVSQFPPTITSGGTASGQTGVPFSYQITAANAPTSFGATGLPPGLAVDTVTGLVSGTPTATGTFNATVTATNGSGTGTRGVVITIGLGPPVVTSAGTASGAQGIAFSYQITASNSPTSFNATGLPPGLTVNTASGLVSGTPTASGNFTATISATNGAGTGSRTLAISLNVGAPVIGGPAATLAATGVAFSYQIIASNAPTSYAASGLPSGLTLDTTTGLISGTPLSAGTFVVALAATNATGTGSGSLTITVSQSAPAVTSPATASAEVGRSFIYLIAITNGPAAVSVSNLPAGLAFDPGTLSISGTPTLGGTYPVTITVANNTGTATFTLTISVAFVVPSARDLEVAVPYETPTPITLPIGGQATQVAIVTQPEHGIATLAGSVVTYTPATGYSGADQFTYAAANPAGTTAPATVKITVGTQVPVASAASMSVELNRSGTLDLARFIKASGLTGVSIATSPAHGTIALNGTQVTYTPRTDFFGRDTFAYVAYGNAGTSQPATVTVTVTGRPDPTRDPNVVGLVDAQAQAARRFSSAQRGNFQRRTESLHRVPLPEGATRAAEAAPAPARTAAPAPAARAPAPGEREPSAVPAALVAPLVGLATTGSVNLDASTGGGSGGGLASGLNAWVGGTGTFGRRNADGDLAGLRFSTDGLSVGLDKRFNDKLALGLGVGWGRDETIVGTDGARSEARARSFAFYGSVQPAASMFVDFVLGAGKLDFDTTRPVAALGQAASGSRKGDQLFGSVSAGAEWRREGLLLSPYGRVDVARDKLKAYAETGVGDYALAFRDQVVRSTQVAAGLRVESVHDTDFGRAVPRARIEYRRELQGEGAVALSYADLLGGPEYTITPKGTSRNALLLGVGADLVYRGGLRIGIDYLAQRSTGANNVQGVRILISQELDGKRAGAWSWQPSLFKDPIGVEAGYTFDDNVNRGRDGERMSDRIYTLSVGEPMPFRLGDNKKLRVMLTPSITVDKYQRYQGLGRFSAGGQAELQYRPSGAFDAITWTLVGRAAYDQYESDRRRGPRFFGGVNARRALTDKVDFFAEAGYNVRDGRSDVFDTRDWTAKLNVDYSLGRRGVLYVSGEYRRGDMVSSGPSSLVNVGLAEVLAPDDAFNGADVLAYRFQGRTILGTVGWNYPLGPRDSLDLSWRRVFASPLERPAFDGGGTRYNVNQYSLVYLMRF